MRPFSQTATRRYGVHGLELTPCFHTGVLTIACLLSILLSAVDADDSLQARKYRLAPTPNIQFKLQGRLIEAIPGDVIELEEGFYQLEQQLDIVSDNITIRGRGSDKTILSFKGQQRGGQGIEATGNNFVLEGLAIEDTSGNAIKVNGARNVTFRDVRVEWTGPAAATNGAYGLYPVQCDNVLIEHCTAIGASDAGLYVGQCRNVIVRHSRAERNVAGIEIENTIHADVYENVATNNAGGLLVFDLPGLQQKAGHDVRVFKNQVIANNHKNFAAPGNMVAGVPSGTGLMVMATDRVEVFDNDIRDNQTSSVSIVSYLVSRKKIKDQEFDAIPEAVSVHDNRISGGGQNPQGNIRELLAPVLGKTFPDILFDGVVNPARMVNGVVPNAWRNSVKNNGGASFVNFQLQKLTPENLKAGKYRPLTDITTMDHELAPLTAVEIRPHDAPTSASNANVLAFRAAPKTLSEYGLFEGNGASQQPVEGVVPYDLNTTLFSDYTVKRRFIRIPEGTTIQYREQDVFDFPVGTVIAKTFSYYRDARDPQQGERLLETRIETRLEDGWHGYAYAWNDEQTEAHLLLGGRARAVTWIDELGRERSMDYVVPNANQCLNCHSQDKKFVPLGPVAANLNRSSPFSDDERNQLEILHAMQWLQGKPAEEEVPSWPREFHEDEPVDERARAWLHVNCAHCHSPRGTARTSGLDLRWSQRNPARFGVWKAPVAAGHGTGGRSYDIVPGKPEESILLYRVESADPSIMMPSVAKQLVPVEAVALLREWIRGLPKE